MSTEPVLSLDFDSNEQNITLVSNDNVEYSVNKEYLMISNFLKTALELENHNNTINVNISSSLLKHIVDYFNYHKGTPGKIPEQPLRSKNLKDLMDEWDVNFIDEIGGMTESQPEKRKVLYDLINAVNYLDIKCLLYISCAKIASLIKGEPLEKIKSILDYEKKN